MKYHIIAVFVICLILGTGLAAAGTLTLTLEPSIDGKGDIKATSITQALLSRYDGIMIICRVYSPCITYKAATITNGTAKFNLSNEDAGTRYIMINNLSDDNIPTRIDDPTKDIQQFVGRKLQVSIIGSLSDPTYRIKTFTARQGYNHPLVNYPDGNYSPEVLGRFGGDAYTVLSLKTNPQRFQVITLGAPHLGKNQEITDYTPTAPTHPSTSTSTNPSFSKWMYGEGSHGFDYGGNDSKCSICHGNLDTKPANFSDITVNNGFCFRCHYGKGGTDNGFIVDLTRFRPRQPTTTTAKLTAAPTTAIPKTPGFEVLSVIAALLAVLLIGRK